jgi:lipopolysaccharide/colanic/teichoic acid biosynthesis glycosyltransferase
VRLAKRSFDLATSICGLVILTPLMLVIAILVKAEDGGSVFFRQERIGRNGRPFRMWKFRTMVPAAGTMGLPLTLAGDPRVTRIGSWLREHKLDELPQLLNVIRGEMTLVGPRPEVPKYVDMYTVEERKVLALDPGITDPASILFADESELLGEHSDPERFYIERIVPEKIRINLDYADRATPLSDLAIILETLGHVVPRTRMQQIRVLTCHKQGASPEPRPE